MAGLQKRYDMESGQLSAELAAASGGVVLFGPGPARKELHPLWLRERVTEADVYDGRNNQRLYEHSSLPPDLRVTEIEHAGEALDVSFSDGYQAQLSLPAIAVELGWRDNPEAPPAPEPWTAGELEAGRWPRASWTELDRPEAMRAFLEGYFRCGFAIVDDTPTEPGSLRTLARRFGFLRETNWGDLFDVASKADASDQAYTSEALSSHTDNPYRNPIPGIQFLHCLDNQAEGGLSTAVDGMALVRALAEESPPALRALEETPVRFRYEGPTGILEHWGPIVERDFRGRVARLRLSSRLDYVPALEPAALETFYRGRRRLHEMAASPSFQVSFPFRPGLLLMLDNHRVLHGRTAYEPGSGNRHLQGCYIDHDGPDCLYRTLRRDGQTTWIRREG